MYPQLDEDKPPVRSERFEENKMSNETLFHILFSSQVSFHNPKNITYNSHFSNSDLHKALQILCAVFSHVGHHAGTFSYFYFFLNLSYSTLKVLQSGHSKPASKCSMLVWAWCCVFLRSSLTTLCRLSVYVGIWQSVTFLFMSFKWLGNLKFTQRTSGITL